MSVSQHGVEVGAWVASSQGFLKVVSADKQGELLLSSHRFYLPPCPPAPHFPFQILPTVTAFLKTAVLSKEENAAQLR